MRTPFVLIKTILGIFLLVVVNGCDDSPPVVATVAPEIHEIKKTTLLNSDLQDARVLVFSKTKGWRHDSIPAGIAALQKMATENFFTVVATDDADTFTDAQLSSFNAIVFLNTTLDVLDDNQQIAMERFIQAGGGFVGIHAAADTEWEGDWYWYRKLIGAVFKNHPHQPSNVQMARVNVKDATHYATEKLPMSFDVVDEWYNFDAFYEFNHVLLTVDETSYHGGEQGAYHPIAWYHEFDGGRSFYTGLGHTIEAYSDPQFIVMLLGGLRYAVGGKLKLDYSKSRPENNRFIKKSLADNLNEPVSLSFFPNGDALIAERAGTAKLVDYKTGELREVGKIDVNYQNFVEMGLLGFAIDPAFERNHFIYAAFNVEKQGEYFQRLSQFKWVDGKINSTSQVVVLEYPIDKNCCHTAGDLQFGNNGELFMSTGDNTNPHDQNGYSPIDFRPDAERNDALRSSANTQDLRGKILRIKPLESGGYDIPSGNLFTDPKDGRPEIYVMGARNPYKITYDKKSSTLFFGDVGPDAGEDSVTQGSRGYDEINRVTQAGNFGWPLFIGNNNAFMDYDYATHTSKKMFNPLVPLNNSPRNTGLKQLPPAQRPLLWYPYGLSEQFPELGKGGRTALVADVYHAADYPQSKNRYPSYYDNKLFIVDFMRNWVKAVSFDAFGRIQKIEPFAPQISYTLPIDSRFAPDGTLYVLEYGMAWFKGNADARLTRVEFVGSGNRPPIAQITLNKSQGAIPLVTHVSAQQSHDLDGDKLTYSWSIKPKNVKAEAVVLGTGEQLPVTIPDAGEYLLHLTVTDALGASSIAEASIHVGNEPAEIVMNIEGNQSFYWPNTSSLKYKLTITDKEDGEITYDVKNVVITFSAQKNTSDVSQEGHQTADNTAVAQDLLKANGCKSCHNVDVKIVGPAFKDIAERYKNDKKALKYLVNKIAKGGNGAWGELNMPAFATLSEADRTTLATYVLSLATVVKTLPLQGELVLSAHTTLQKLSLQKSFDSLETPKNFSEPNYELNAAYTDNGGTNIGPITTTKSLVLIPARLPLVPLVKSNSFNKLTEQGKFLNHDTVKVLASGNWQTFHLGKYDLTDITALQLGGWITKQNTQWHFEVRLGSDTGTVLAAGESSTKAVDVYFRSLLKLQTQRGLQDLYLAIRSTEKSASELQLLDVSFHR